MLKNRYLNLAVIAGLVILLDQVTKALILHYLPLHQNVAVIPGFFDITHIHNPGGAFGFLSGVSSKLRSVIFLFISSLAVGLIFYFYKKTPSSLPWLSAAFALIFGGAIGNLVDRLRFGVVVDFLDLYIGNWHWPAFNIADSAITVGIIVFIVHLVFNKIPD